MNTLKKWWLLHKTKALGFLTLLSGLIHQYSTQLQQFLKPAHYSIILVVVGAAVAVFGFLNSSESKNGDTTPQA